MRASVGWNEGNPDGIAAGLSSSLYAVVLERDGDAVGCGRVVGDGGIYLYVSRGPCLGLGVDSMGTCGGP